MFSIFKSKKKTNQVIEDPLKPQRFNDGIIIVTQNNDEHTLNIEAANMNALNLLGYTKDDILDKDIRDFLTDRIIDDINEYLEFELGGNELDNVLSRVRRFKMKKKDGSIVSLRLRIVKSLSSKDYPRFQLIINDDTLSKDIEENREKYRASLRGDEIFDKTTGLLSLESIAKDVELIAFNAKKRDLKSYAVTIKISNFDKLKSQYDEIVINRALKDIALVINRSKRDYDIAGILETGKFLVILTETPEDSITKALERLRKPLELGGFESREKDGKKVKLDFNFDIKSQSIEFETKIEDLI